MIVKYPDNILDQVSVSALENLTKDEIDNLCSEMRKECWQVNGFGIAAIQIGQPYRAFGILNPNKRDLMWMIDPQIRRCSGSITYTEGCLSIPGYFWDVTRYNKLSISFFNSEGAKHYRTFSGIYARIIQHEMDHIDGLLIPDLMDDDKFINFDNHFSSILPASEYDAPKISVI